jgi:S-adenosylmethionine:tRNA ribosyltransferase-isomerase
MVRLWPDQAGSGSRWRIRASLVLQAGKGVRRDGTGSGRTAFPAISARPAMTDASAIPDLSDYDYLLPPERIAQAPAERRDDARLLVVGSSGLQDRRIADLPDLLEPGDLLVANDSAVMRARCMFRRESGGAVEVLFLDPGPGPVRAMLRPARRLRAGELLVAAGGIVLRLVAPQGGGIWRVESEPPPLAIMDRIGHVPLPPYIRRHDTFSDRERYQTVFARDPGSAAAPTAGLHLDGALLGRLTERGIGFATVTLRVGIATFRPLRQEDLEAGLLHDEEFVVSEATARAVAETRHARHRVIAVGTTTIRALESAVPEGGATPVAGSGSTRLFIRPGYRFRAVDGFVTNFHLPRSSLLVLVAAWLGRERLFACYRHAVDHGYRFYSYGDAMLVL